MANYDVGFSYWTRVYGNIDNLPADSIDDVDDKAFDYYKQFFIGDDDEDEFSDFMVESILEVKDQKPNGQ